MRVMGQACGTYEKIIAYIILVRKPAGKRPLGRSKRGG
jgi:hypothetical protein